MSRRHAAEKREILPDAKYGDRVVSKFMNNLMIDGKKSVAERIVYSAFDRVEGRLKKAPVEVFHEALAIRWLISAAKNRNENTMEERLAGELLDAVNGRGTAVKKREDTHKMADANKAFSHYRW
jgi:small subunit ribosomal protein S7